MWFQQMLQDTRVLSPGGLERKEKQHGPKVAQPGTITHRWRGVRFVPFDQSRVFFIMWLVWTCTWKATTVLTKRAIPVAYRARPPQT